MKKYTAVAAVAALLASLALWGCKNGNMFGGFHKKGSGDAASLMSDARSALANREFNNAKAYYEAILAQQPTNSVALYGAAVATMGTAGLDLGTLLSNVVASKGAPASGSLAQLIDSAAIGAPGAATVDPRSVLNNLNLTALRLHINTIICYLSRIRAGRGDGVIPRDDVSTCLSLTISRTLRAVLRTTDPTVGVADIRKSANGKDLEVVITASGATINDYCGGTSGKGKTMEATLDDLAGAVEALGAAFNKVNPGVDATLTEIKADINKAFTDFKTDVKAQGVNAACAGLLDSAKYDVLNLPVPTTDDCAQLGQACCSQ